jgi:hypothetical protein
LANSDALSCNVSSAALKLRKKFGTPRRRHWIPGPACGGAMLPPYGSSITPDSGKAR